MEISNSAYSYGGHAGFVEEATASLPEEQVVRAWLSIAKPGTNLRSLTGKNILILSSGERNIFDGPDFLDSELIVDGKGIKGAIEIHHRIEEWYLHKHHLNHNYDAVILHVVLHPPDGPLPSSLPETIALASLMTREDRRRELYSADRSQQFACPGSTSTAGLPTEESMLILAASQRLDRKLHTVRLRYKDLMAANDADRSYRQLLYERMARALGYGGNADLMQEFAAHVPVKEIVSSGNLSSAEILRVCENKLHEFGLHQRVRKKSVRPQNRVSERLPMLVSTCNFLVDENYFGLLRNSVIAQARSNPQDALIVLLRKRIDGLGIERCREMIVNAIAPWAIHYAELAGDMELHQAAVRLYFRSPGAAENRITKQWKSHFGSPLQRFSGNQQGMIEMVKNYCSPASCKHCLLAV